jgi:tetratricopeptide (TPR) repeat protein
MKNKLYMAALILILSCLTTGASAQEVHETYESFQKQEENIVNYQKLIQEDWHNTKAHNDLGEVYLKLRRLEEAEKEFKAALETDRVYSLGPFLFGDIYTDAERYQDKISDFQKVIEQNNEFARSHKNLGGVRLVEKKLELAQEAYNEALRINPEYVQAHNGLGMVHAQLGQLDKAIEEYELALSIDDNNTVANYNLGLVYNKKNEHDQALPYLTKARELYKEANNEGQEKHLAGLIKNLTGTQVAPTEQIQSASNTSDHLGNTLELRLAPAKEDLETPVTDQVETVQIASKEYIKSRPADSISIKDETITEDEQVVKALKVRSVNGEFMANERNASLEDTTVTNKVAVKKELQNKSEDPFVGDWIFEYPK